MARYPTVGYASLLVSDTTHRRLCAAQRPHIPTFRVAMNATADKEAAVAKLADGVEGTTTFPSRHDSSYRFRFDAKQGKLRFWLEDRKTKQQWQTAELEMKDFVPKDCVIQHTVFDDYAVCFLSCLESPLPSDKFERDLVPSEAERDVRVLRLTLKLRTFVSTWTPTYCFVLDPVPLERVDLLAAQVRDQKEVIERLANELEAVRSGSPPYLHATLMNNTTSGKTLVWAQVQGNSEVIEVLTDGSIQIKKDGVFAINASINNFNSKTVKLLVNGTNVISVADSSAPNQQCTTALTYVLMAKPDDKISVIYTGTGVVYSPSSIIIYQLR